MRSPEAVEGLERFSMHIIRLWTVGSEPGLAQTWLSPVDGVIVRGDCVRVPGTGGPFANWQQRGELVTGRGIVPVGMRLTRGCVIRTGLLGVSLWGGSELRGLAVTGEKTTGAELPKKGAHPLKSHRISRSSPRSSTESAACKSRRPQAVRAAVGMEIIFAACRRCAGHYFGSSVVWSGTGMAGWFLLLRRSYLCRPGNSESIPGPASPG